MGTTFRLGDVGLLLLSEVMLIGLITAAVIERAV